jgi:MFS family permease
MTAIITAGSKPAVSNAYRNYILGVLCLAYSLNFLDRNIISILVDPIKTELHVSDTAMGSLSGFAFAIFYAAVGIPIARWADAGNRRNIITIGLTVWSAMTALSGMATNFWQLALARVGVGVGEAAGAPPSHSLISDYFPKHQRAGAMAVFQASIYLGLLMGYLIGGWVNQYYGWRMAFVAAGMPGLFFALVVRFTIREPLRGQFDLPRDGEGRPPLGQVLHFLCSQKSFLLVAFGIGIVGLTNFAFSVWAPSFLRRIYHLQSGQIGTYLGFIKGIGGATGTVLGGIVVDRFRSRDERWMFLLPAIATALVCPAWIGFVTIPSLGWSLVCLAIGAVLIGFHLGPCFAMVQNLARPEMRSLSSSITFLVMTLLGMGLGPLAVGYLSDSFRPELGDGSLRLGLAVTTAACLLGALSFLRGAKFVRSDLAKIRGA